MWRRTLSTSVIRNKNYYDELGVSPRATQADIKNAYYKLSKTLHPDINKETGASARFSAINQAYEILGNVKLKKLYDKGVIQDTSVSDWKPPDKTKVKKSPIRNNQNQIYDYDEWTKWHYQTTFQHAQWSKESVNMRRQYTESVKEKRINNLSVLSIVVSFIVVISVLYDFNDPDSVE